MKILVTGGAGLIGSHLIDALLAGGHKVAVMDDLSSGLRENVPAAAEFHQLDIRDRERVVELVGTFRPDSIAHQAAQMSVSRSVREPVFDADVNLLGLLNVLSAAVDAATRRFVFASSGGVMYGDVDFPAPEETPPNPMTPYGISKWCGERYLRFFAQQHGLECVALRYANVYGARQNPHGEAGVVAIFCTKMLSGEQYTINGDGKYIRDYVHVSDVVRANILALEGNTPGFEAFNVGTGRPTDVNELAALLAPHCQAELRKRGLDRTVPGPRHGPPRSGDLRSNLVSFSRVEQHLGWAPRVELRRGLEETAAWFADRLL